MPNLNYVDQINDQINDQIKIDISDLGLAILQCINNNPGIKVSGIFETLSSSFEVLTLNMIRNSIKRELGNNIELRGPRKTGGYFIK